MRDETATGGDDRAKGRVLYHLRTQGTGSEGIHIRGMVTAFRGMGYEVDFLWPLGTGDPTARAGANPYDTSRRKSRMELVIPLIPGPVFAVLEYCYNFWSSRNFRKLLRSKRYDFVYERHFFFSFASGLAAKKAGIPLVVEVNELAGFERVRGNHLSGLAKRCERSLLESATVVSVVSTFLRDSIISQYPGVDPQKILVVPNGVEESFFTRKTDGKSVRRRFGIENSTVFGFVGFFLHVESWHFLEWFLPVFIDAVIDRPDVVLLLVGDGPGRAGLEEIGRRKGFEDRMIFTGTVPNDRIGDYIDAMDAGTVPHTNEYRSPIKLFEYMAYAKPVLAPDQEPVETVVGEIQPHYLFRAKDDESLKKAIATMLGDRASWADLGIRLRELAQSKYTYEKHGQTILNVLEGYKRQNT